MKREEAIELLEDLDGAIEDNQGRDYDEAFRMAIEALSADAVQGGDAEMDNCQVQAPQNYMQQSRHNDGTDLISRADAIEAVGEWMQKEYGYLDLNRAERLIDALSALPSADTEPKRVLQGYCKGANTIKTIRHEELKQIANTRKAVESADAVQGEWEKTTDGNGWNEWYVLKCPLCDATIEDKQNRKWEYNYCPNCGARMKGGDDE